MKLQMKREALEKMNRLANECGFSRSFTQGFSPSFTHPRVLFLSF